MDGGLRFEGVGEVGAEGVGGKVKGCLCAVENCIGGFLVLLWFFLDNLGIFQYELEGISRKFVRNGNSHFETRRS